MYTILNCAGLACRVEIFGGGGGFVKKHGISAIAHASVSPAFVSDQVHFGVIGAVVSKWPVTQTQASVEKSKVKLGRWG